MTSTPVCSVKASSISSEGTAQSGTITVISPLKAGASSEAWELLGAAWEEAAGSELGAAGACGGVPPEHPANKDNPKAEANKLHKKRFIFFSPFFAKKISHFSTQYFPFLGVPQPQVEAGGSHSLKGSSVINII